ncbi:hypothetical protein D3C81_1591020 [compost metagenome]
MAIFNVKNEEKVTQDHIDDTKELVSHLMEVGWRVHHEYLEKAAKSYSEYDSNEQDFLARLMWGRFKDKYHLVSSCKQYAAIIGYTESKFVKINPNWETIATWKNKNIQMFDKGIKFGICKIIVEQAESDWSNLEVRKGYRGGWTTKSEKEIKEMNDAWSRF